MGGREGGRELVVEIRALEKVLERAYIRYIEKFAS